MRKEAIRTTGIETTQMTPQEVQELMDPMSDAYNKAISAQEGRSTEDLIKEIEADSAGYRSHAKRTREMIKALDDAFDEVA